MAKVLNQAKNYEDGEEGKSSLRSVERVIAILQLFAHEKNGLNTQDIATLTGIPKSTCFRLLRCLVEAEMLEKTGSMFGVGNSIMRMAQGGQMYERIRRVALPHLRKLSRQTGKSVGLSVVNRDNFRLCIELVQNASQELRHHTPLQTPLPLNVGATGKLLWAYLPEKRQLQVYKDNAMDMSETWSQIQELLGSIRRDGYFFSANERIWGACSVVAPVLTDEGGLLAVLTISAVQQQFTQEENQDYIALLQEAALNISKNY